MIGQPSKRWLRHGCTRQGMGASSARIGSTMQPCMSSLRVATIWWLDRGAAWPWGGSRPLSGLTTMGACSACLIHVAMERRPHCEYALQGGESRLMARPRGAETPNYQVRALQRGLTILQTFSEAEPTQSLAEISRRLDIPKATTLRLLECLRHETWLTYDADRGRYALGIAALEIGSAYLAAAR